MVQTIKIPAPEGAAEQDADRPATRREAIQQVASAAASIETCPSIWEDRFAFVLDHGLSLPGAAAVQDGRPARDGLADGFSLQIAAGCLSESNEADSMSGARQKLLRLLVDDKQVGVDLSACLPRDADEEGMKLCDAKRRLERVCDYFGAAFKPAALSLSCSHPDIESFFDLYLDDGPDAPMVAVRITHEFMEAVRSRRAFPLRHRGPGRDGDPDAAVRNEIDAESLWKRLLHVSSHARHAHLVLENCARPMSPLGHTETADSISPLLGHAAPAECAQIVMALDLSCFVDGCARLKTRLLRRVLKTRAAIGGQFDRRGTLAAGVD